MTDGPVRSIMKINPFPKRVAGKRHSASYARAKSETQSVCRKAAQTTYEGR